MFHFALIISTRHWLKTYWRHTEEAFNDECDIWISVCCTLLAKYGGYTTALVGRWKSSQKRCWPQTIGKNVWLNTYQEAIELRLLSQQKFSSNLYAQLLAGQPQCLVALHPADILRLVKNILNVLNDKMFACHYSDALPWTKGTASESKAGWKRFHFGGECYRYQRTQRWWWHTREYKGGSLLGRAVSLRPQHFLLLKCLLS